MLLLLLVVPPAPKGGERRTRRRRRNAFNPTIDSQSEAKRTYGGVRTIGKRIEVTKGEVDEGNDNSFYLTRVSRNCSSVDINLEKRGKGEHAFSGGCSIIHGAWAY